MFKAQNQKLLRIIFFTLILCFSMATPSFAEEAAPTPGPPACLNIGVTEGRDEQYTSTYEGCAAFLYRKPLELLNGQTSPAGIEEYTGLVSNQKLWGQANDTNRTAYCQVIDCLSNRMRRSNAAQITPAECNISSYSPNNFLDGNCQSLLCESNDGGNKYYSDNESASIERLAGGNKNCKIDTPKELCLAALPAKINECNQCRDAINRYTSNGEEPKESCRQYLGVSSCSNFYVCESGSTPTVRTYQRTPFGTEFFDVTSDEKGLGANTEGNFTVNAEGGGIVGTINTIANFLARMISVLSLVVFIIGAFILIIANGEENQINRGKDAIKLSILGIVIVMLSYTIVVLVQSIFF